jgi:hypothetical protein
MRSISGTESLWCGSVTAPPRCSLVLRLLHLKLSGQAIRFILGKALCVTIAIHGKIHGSLPDFQIAVTSYPDWARPIHG